jgi:anti-sigma factor RsiW
MSEQCLSVNDLAAFVDGKIFPEERPRIEGHLSRCAKCREIVVFAFRNKDTLPASVVPKPSVE